jgi:signal transduction histidine kinase
MVKRFVEMHQGTIWAESEKNTGMLFFAEIPYQHP